MQPAEMCHSWQQQNALTACQLTPHT